MPSNPTRDEIKHRADRALQQWARNVTATGVDLGLPHMSPEQKMLPSGTGPAPDLTETEAVVLRYMALLPNGNPRLYLVAKLTYLEEQAWYGHTRANGGWRDLHSYSFTRCTKPTRLDWLKYVEANYQIPKSTYYDLLNQLRHRVFALL